MKLVASAPLALFQPRELGLVILAISETTQPWRSAETIGNRVARAAGKRLPMTPIAATNKRPQHRSARVTRKAKEISPVLAVVLALIPLSSRRRFDACVVLD